MMNLRTVFALPLLALPLLAVSAANAQLPPVPVPAANPITEPKRVLGKVLFFDEQLSSDNTVACATCHTMRDAGGDARRVRHPGSDNIFNTPDDVFASPGVIRSDSLENYLRDAVFGVLPQVTNRTANSPINAAFAPVLFWDGRARGQFVDPETSLVLIPNGGALESQTVAPPLSTVEMAHEDINWSEVSAKLAASRPLALATNAPADVAAALTGSPDYPELFRRAFGDTTITAARIAMAIATYERTLIADNTPWDRFIAGQTNALTPGQAQGWQIFQNSRCNACHIPPLFTGNGFRNIGVRPPAEDLGLQGVTGLAVDAGKFKVPGLRNVGLKNTFMHNGQFTNLTDLIRFYARAPGAAPQFPQNQDPLMQQVNVPGNAAPALQDFLTNGLTDARVRDGLFPFDAPILYTQRPADRPINLGGGVAGSGGIIPAMIASSPPMIGSLDFKLGLFNALGGASARLSISTSPPVAGRIAPMWIFGSTPTTGAGNGNGLATHHWPLTSKAGGVIPGQTIYAQWFITDPNAVGGEALSNVVSIRFFCGSAGCPATCIGDFNDSGQTTVQDVFDFLSAYFANDLDADVDASLTISVQDVFDFLTAYFEPCP